ncbi:MAG: phage major capsid protein [Clostridia bacterium]|nr:phage major capsid protein [Clostridia bacterium]
MVTLQTAENALKEVYLGVVANQLNVNANPLLAKIKRSNKDVWGKEIRKLAPFGINGGVGAGSETGALPTASGNGYVQFVSELKNLFGKIEISDKAVRASANNAGAFVNLLSDEMEGLVKASSFNLGRMIYGDGTGLIATVASVDDNTVACDKVNNLIEGMLIDVYTGDSKTSAAPIKVVYVDRVNKTFKFSGNATVTAGDKLYVQGSKDYEISGLGKIFDETQTEIYGVSKTEYPWLKPFVSTASTEISDILIQEAIDFLDMNTDSQINFISCSSKVRRAYQEYLGAYRRNIEVAELEGGYKTITHNGIPVVADRFVDDDTMYLLNTNDFTLHELCDWKWLEGEDGRILKQNQGYPTYSATLVKYGELICDKPCGQAKISGISSTVTNPFVN